MRKYLLFLGIGMLFSFISYSQDFSNKGKEFWLVFPAHTPSSGQAQMGLFLTSDQNSSGTISVNGFNTTFTVLANQVTGPIDIPYANANVGVTNTVVNKGIHVQVNAGQPGVELYAHIYAGFRSEASLILPVNTLGKDYYSSNFYQRSTSGSQSQFNIVATEANTVVQYQLRVNGVLSPTVNTVSLPNPGDEIQVQNANDLTGSVITSVASGLGGCKKIAVFSGSSSLAIGNSGCTPGSYDPLFQQCYPVSTWGKNFGVIPFTDNTSFHVRVMAAEDNTTVNFNGTVVVLANAGDYYPATSANPVALSSPYTPAGVNPNPLIITADKSICVTQYMESANCSGSANFPGQTNGQGDPDMVILNPVEQNISDINIFSSNLQNIRTKYLNVYMKTAGTASFTINGTSPTSSWVAMPQGNGYSYLRQDLSAFATTSLRLKADSGFNAISYGMGDAESYAYSAGTNVKDLYQQISVSTQYGIETSPSVCSNSPFRFKISLPYKPLQLTWDISGLPASTNPNTSPTTQLPTPGTCATFPIPADANTYVCPDSITTVNGIPIYWYSIPTYYSIPTIGSYPIHLVAQTSNTDGCGTEQDIDFDLNVSDPPVADFNYTIPACVADTVHFSDASVTVKPNYHWYWDFGDPGSGLANNTSNLQNPKHVYSSSGTHVVRFSSITTPGCLSDTISKTVTVPAQPTATISGTIAVCQNPGTTQVQITGANGTPPYIFSYHINAGPIIQTAPAPSVIINAPDGTVGVFTYTLDSVKNAAGSSLCDTHVIGQSATVTVNPLPTATIGGNTTLCQNDPAPTITFTGANATQPYTFYYTLIGPGGAGPQQSITTTVGNSVTITAPTGVSGNYTYTLNDVIDGSATACANPVSGSVLIAVHPLPTATISGNAELCLNAAGPTITFTGAGGTAPYKFTYTINGLAQPIVQSPGATSVATVTAPTTTAGTYVYSLVSVQESSSTLCQNNQAGTATVTVDPQPTASFTYTTPDCESKNITFTPTFGVGTGSVVSWIWDYGDGTGSHSRPDGNPFIITYATAGTKTVTFKTISDKGCISAVYTQNVVVSATPVAGFISPQICLLDPFAQFNDTSHVATGQPGTITNWQWNFGDPNATPGNPNTSTATNPTHVYTQVGPYTVQLTVTSSFGCVNTVSQGIFISDGNPQSNFNVLNAANLCSNDSVGIQNKSTILSGNITKLEIYWDYLNQPAVFTTQNDPAFDQIFKHKYPTLTTAQNYTIHVRAYSGGVCYSSKDIIVTVHAAPVAQLNAIPDVCLNNGTVQFTQGGETAGVPGTGVYTGAGVSLTGLFNPLTAGVGPHTITYTFTSNFGCVDIKTTTVKVLAAPVANFAPAAVTCQNNSITFTQSSTATAGTIVSWTWHWGDGSPDETYTNGNPRSHTYITSGSFTASLLVITDYGCKSTPKLVTFTVNPQPLPNFTFTPVACLPQAKIDFNNTTPNISDWGYQWTFDDINANVTNPNVSTAVNPSHIYTTVGPHNVLLVSTSATTSCTNSITIPVNSIHPAPTASFSMNKQTICTDQTVQLTDLSNPADGVFTTWAWDYNDNTGIAQGQVQPPHIYTDAGNYTIVLTVTNNFGCTDDTSRPLIVYPYPVVDAGPDQTVLQDGLTYLQGTASGNQLVYLWTPATYLGATNILTPAVHPHEDITYRLTVTAQGGCAASDTIHITVLKAPLIPNTFTPNNDGVHDLWEIKYLFQYPDNHVQVFTRTGQLVFESHGYSKPWNGTKDGKPLPFDTYYYIIEPGSGRAPITGYVTIIK